MSKRTIWILIGCAILLTAGIVIGGRCNVKNPQSIATIEQIKNSPVIHTKDPGGTDHAEKQVAVGDADAMRAGFVKTIDSLTKLIKGKPKASDVDEFTEVGMESIGQIANGVESEYSDTGRCADLLTWKDAWMKVEAHKVSGNWLLSYHNTDSLNLIAYWKKKGFKKVLTIDAFSYNPNTIITGLNSIQAPSFKPKKFGLGTSIGYGYFNGKFRPYAGVGLQWNLIRF